MVLDETLLNYSGLNVLFVFHINVYDVKLGAIISNNNKSIIIFLKTYQAKYES